MADIDAVFDKAAADMHATLGGPATYTPAGGAGIAWTAVVSHDQALLDGDGMISGRATTVSGPVLAGVHYGAGDIIDVAGTLYAVHAPLENDGYSVTLVVTPA